MFPKDFYEFLHTCHTLEKKNNESLSISYGIPRLSRFFFDENIKYIAKDSEIRLDRLNEKVGDFVCALLFFSSLG